MNGIADLALALAAGVGIGAFYFGALWLTVRKLPTMRRPGMTLAVSFLMRMGMALFLMYIVMSGHWERLAACVAGFLAARYFMLKRLGPEGVRFGTEAE